MTIHPITYIAINSSLLEIRTWPKPGNVHKTHNFSSTTYSDFLTVCYESISIWENLITVIKKSEHPPSTLYVSHLLKTVKYMMMIQSGGNVLLGHYLLMLPLFISAVYCEFHHIQEESIFWDYTRNIIHNSTVNDTILLYQALREAQPGGMGTRKKYDVFSKKYKQELMNDEITLAKIFNLSKNYDAVSRELVTNYKFIRETVIPEMEHYLKGYSTLGQIFPDQFQKALLQEDNIEMSENLNEFIIRVFLFILSKQNDTLISRKTNIEQSKLITKHAHLLIQNYTQESRHDWFEQVQDFDAELQKGNGKLNPGTTADLVACSIFVYILKKYLFS